MPLSGGNKEEITVIMLPDTNSRESKVWSVMGEDGTNFARAANSETEKLGDANEGNRQDNNLDSCKASKSIGKKEDFRSNLAQATAVIKDNEEGISIQVVSKGDDDDVVDNLAMSKIDHGHVEDRTKCLMNAATMTNIDTQDVIDQRDVKTEELINALTEGQGQDTENSMECGTHLREHVFTSNRKERVGSCIRPISNRNYLCRNRDIDTGAISSTSSQRNVSPTYYGREKLEGSMADILKPMKKERKNISKVLKTKFKIFVTLNGRDKKSVGVNVDVVSKQKPKHVAPHYNIEEEINVQATSDHDTGVSNVATTSNDGFEIEMLEDGYGMDISIDSIDQPDGQNPESTVPLIHINENVILTKEQSGQDIINWYNYFAMVRQPFKYLGNLITRKNTGTVPLASN